MRTAFYAARLSKSKDVQKLLRRVPSANQVAVHKKHDNVGPLTAFRPSLWLLVAGSCSTSNNESLGRDLKPVGDSVEPLDRASVSTLLLVAPSVLLA